MAKVYLEQEAIVCLQLDWLTLVLFSLLLHSDRHRLSFAKQGKAKRMTGLNYSSKWRKATALSIPNIFLLF